MAGFAVAAAAYAGRYSMQAYQAFKTRPPTATLRRFYEGGFQPIMNRKEAALILGVRYNLFIYIFPLKYEVQIVICFFFGFLFFSLHQNGASIYKPFILLLKPLVIWTFH